MNKAVQQFIIAVAREYSLDENDLDEIWKKSSATLETTVASAVVDMDDLSPARLSKLNGNELKALCKKHGKKVSGKKEELIARLTGKEEPVAKEKKEKKEKEETKEKKSPSARRVANANRAETSNDVLKKLVARIPNVVVSKNSFGHHEHPPSRLVFDKLSKKVIGRQLDSGKIAPLNEEDIENCKKYNFAYDLPGNLDQGSGAKVKIEELEESDVEEGQVEEEEDNIEIEEDEDGDEEEEEADA